MLQFWWGRGTQRFRWARKTYPWVKRSQSFAFFENQFIYFFSRRYFQLSCNLILEAAPRGSSLHFKLEGRRVDQWFLTELEGQLSHRLLLKFLIFPHQKVNIVNPKEAFNHPGPETPSRGWEISILRAFSTQGGVPPGRQGTGGGSFSEGSPHAPTTGWSLGRPQASGPPAATSAVGAAFCAPRERDGEGEEAATAPCGPQVGTGAAGASAWRREGSGGTRLPRCGRHLVAGGRGEAARGCRVKPRA